MKRMLVTRTDYDGGTSYMFHWTQSVIDKAEKSFKVTDLKRKN